MSSWRIVGIAAALLFVSCFDSAKGAPELLLGLDGFTISDSETQVAEAARDGSVELTLKKANLPVRSLVISTSGAVVKVKVEVASLTGAPRRLSPVPDVQVYQYLQIRHPDVEDGDIISATIRFSVANDWLESEGYLPDDIALARYTDVWTALPTHRTGEDGEETEFEALSPGLSLFAIGGIDARRSVVGIPSPSPTPPVTPTSSPWPVPTATAILSGVVQTTVPKSGPQTARSPIVSRTPTPTRTGSTPTPTPTPTPRITIVKQTPTPAPTPAPTAAPIPTPTPVPSDPRYGVVLHSESAYFLDQLRVSWYLNFDAGTSQIPFGANKVLFIQVPTDSGIWNSGQAESIESLTDEQIAALGFHTRAQLQNMASSTPGSHWYLWGEPNRYGIMTGARFAPVLRYFITWLKAGDTSAQIIGPSILNWDYTCLGCPGFVLCSGTLSSLTGYQCGKDWLIQLIAAYEALYGEKPPVDAWAIDAYPIDWFNLPNNDPLKPAFYAANGRGFFRHSQIVTEQIDRMRAYLDSIPEYATTPIWITEIAIHVGYDDIDFGKLLPLGNYHWDFMSEYLNEVLDWLELNAADKRIERWFFFTSWKNILEPPGNDPYMGIIFFDGPDEGASLNCLGRVYRARALGQQPLSCDVDGNVVP